MAHIFTVTDGVTTLNLAETTDAGYHFVTLRPPRPNRVLSRVSGYPFTSGQQTTASGLLDGAVEVVLHIVGTSADDVESRLLALTNLLGKAQAWEETRLVAPVRLTWRRQGATNIAYRVITGVPSMPEPVDPEEGDWLDISTVTNDLTVAFTVTLEPTWHAQGTTVSVLATAVTTTPLANTVTASAPINGDMPAAINVKASNTNTMVWDTVWLAELGGAPDVQDTASTTVDGGAYGGFTDIRTAGATAFSLASLSFPMDEKYRYPLRSFFRAKVTAGDSTKLQLQFVVRFGSVTWLTTPYQTWSGPASGFYLMDFGTLSANSLFNRILQSNAVSEISYLVNYKTSDGSAVSFASDYFEVIPYRSLVRLHNMATADTGHLAYEDLQYDNAFVWPRRTPATYGVFSTFALHKAAERYGRLLPLRPGTTPMFWFNAASSTTHQLAATASATLTISYQAAYSLGLRGAG